MAKLIQAFTVYGPKINLMEAADPQRFMELITQRTTLSAGVVKNVQESEVETLIGLLKEGRPPHTGVAIFRPVIDAQGNLVVKCALYITRYTVKASEMAPVSWCYRLYGSNKELSEPYLLKAPDPYLCYEQSLVDGINRERFQIYAVLLAICKVHRSPLDVQWKGWLFETLARENEQTKNIAEER